jgi:hypothetical protein
MLPISLTLVSDLDQSSFKKFSAVGPNLKEINKKLDWEFHVKLSGARSQDIAC